MRPIDGSTGVANGVALHRLLSTFRLPSSVSDSRFVSEIEDTDYERAHWSQGAVYIKSFTMVSLTRWTWGLTVTAKFGYLMEALMEATEGPLQAYLPRKRIR